jgi:hypothetical protein
VQPASSLLFVPANGKLSSGGREGLFPWERRARPPSAAAVGSARPLIVDRAASSFVLLEKEPAVALEILRPISSAGRALVNAGQDRRTGGFGSCEVRIEVFHEDEHTIDNPWDRRPLTGLLADRDGASGSGSPV